MNSLKAHTQEKRLFQLLLQLGYQYLNSGETIDMRGGDYSQILLEPILREQIKRINGNVITEADIDEAIGALHNAPLQNGYLPANQYIYDLLRQGIQINREGNSEQKSYHIQYIDWDYPANNQFHITNTYQVTRNGQQSGFTPDVVLFVNGIPVSIIELKVYHKGDNGRGAIEQHLRNQLPGGIRELYLYSHILFSLTGDNGKYATNGTPAEYWQTWQELCPAETRHTLQELLEHPPTAQDELLYNMARPERLIDLLRRFIIYTNGTKRIARPHQYFAVHEATKRIHQKEGNTRGGGMIWHTQGSGKTLTMVMLAQAIQQDKTINNPRIIVVTDRIDADHQLTDLFHSSKTYVQNATTGKNLADWLENKTSGILTTVVQKIEPAMRKLKKIEDSLNIFILADEALRIQEPLLHSNIQQMLPNACFIGFTGMPFTENYRSTVKLFDKHVLSVYRLREAVNEGMVLPLKYETHIPDTIHHSTERMKAVAKDISEDFRIRSKDKKGTFKGMLTCSDRFTAIRYKKYFDEIGTLSTEVYTILKEEPEDILLLKDLVDKEVEEEMAEFRNRIASTYGSVGKYHENLLYRFKNSTQPELLIVVDMLLNGFDEPKNSVLYIDRRMHGHSLLQAIARVNRVSPGKEYGYIVDYYGISKELKHALGMMPEDAIGMVENSGYESFIISDYKKTFDTKIEQIIQDITIDRIEASDFFKNIEKLHYPILQTDISTELINNNNFVSAFYPIVQQNLGLYSGRVKKFDQLCQTISKEIDQIIQKHIYIEGLMIVDWQNRIDIRRILSIELTDYLIDRVKKELDIPLSWDNIENLPDKFLKAVTRTYIEERNTKLNTKNS